MVGNAPNLWRNASEALQSATFVTDGCLNPDNAGLIWSCDLPPNVSINKGHQESAMRETNVKTLHGQEANERMEQIGPPGGPSPELRVTQVNHLETRGETPSALNRDGLWAIDEDFNKLKSKWVLIAAYLRSDPT
jgi:hypothetical protein